MVGISTSQKKLKWLINTQLLNHTSNRQNSNQDHKEITFHVHHISKLKSGNDKRFEHMEQGTAILESNCITVIQFEVTEILRPRNFLVIYSRETKYITNKI